jgi:rod shape-determining protein MreC
LVIIGQTSLISPIRGAASKIINPLQYGTYQMAQNLKGELDFFSKLRHLRTQNLKLSDRVLEAESKLSDYKELERENNLLREQLAVAERTSSQKFVLAEIVGRSTQAGEATVTVNRGSEDGVRQGAAVVFKNFLLGEVFEVEPKRARIRLLTDPQFSVAALDQDSPERTGGLARGQYGTTLVLQKILPTEPLVVGDTIITSGEDGKFAGGLILGRVKRILGQEAEVFKSAELGLFVNVANLEEVFVVR